MPEGCSNLNVCCPECVDVGEAGHSWGAKRLECMRLALHLIRTSGTADAPWALLVNPARGGLFIEPGPYNASQTPLGVTCESSPLLCHRERVNRSPLTGFGSGIARSGYYKQATPNGVLGQQTAECKDECKFSGLPPLSDHVDAPTAAASRTHSKRFAHKDAHTVSQDFT
jgi:hypothetical protein